MKSYLIKCNYSKALIQDGINKALDIDRKDLIHPTGNAGTIMTVTQSPLLVLLIQITTIIQL